MKNLLKMPVSKLTLKARERGESEAWQKTRLATLGSGSEILSLFSGVKREETFLFDSVLVCNIYRIFADEVRQNM